MLTDNEQQQWYVRRGSTIQGPYGLQQIRRYLLLGRLRLTDRASGDGENWHAITQCADLIPEEMRDLESEEGRARFEAARRAVDEREEPDPSDDVMRGGERADDLPEKAPSRRWGVLGLAVAVAAMLVAIGLYGNLGAGPIAARDCDAEPAAGVNWNYCSKDGLVLAPGADLRGVSGVNATFRDARLAGVALSDAALSYADLTGADIHDADLTGADLEGANLRRTDLSGAILTDANLAHADLRGATLDGARLDGANLQRAVWIDGRPCTPDEMERCRLRR